ncbi:MAG: hypothetical protein QG641_766 [Candidatus Poribacteria bacterium]|nr:hypothetical protein [Candidatus Poribacteria bacterium]
MKLFFDTSALIKYFHEEKGTEFVTKLIDDPENYTWISELSMIEFYNFSYRFYRESRISDMELNKSINGFERRCTYFNTVALNLAVVNGARELLTKYGKRFPLRSLDSVQLVSYNLVYENGKDWAFVTSDDRLIQILQSIGMKVINPQE